MKRTIALAASLLVLAGCGSSGSESEGTRTPGDSTAGAAVNPDNMETDDSAPEGALQPEVLPVGKAGLFYEGNNAEGNLTELSVRMESVSCGSEKLTTYDAEAQEDREVPPPAGQKFCIVRAVGTNVGSRPVTSAPATAGVVTTDGKLYASSNDLDSYKVEMDPDDGSVSGFGFSLLQPLNPGQTVNISQVFQVPEGAKLKELSFPDDLMTFTLPAN